MPVNGGWEPELTCCRVSRENRMTKAIGKGLRKWRKRAWCWFHREPFVAILVPSAWIARRPRIRDNRLCGFQGLELRGIPFYRLDEFVQGLRFYLSDHSYQQRLGRTFLLRCFAFAKRRADCEDWQIGLRGMEVDRGFHF